MSRELAALARLPPISRRTAGRSFFLIPSTTPATAKPCCTGNRAIRTVAARVRQRGLC